MDAGAPLTNVFLNVSVKGMIAGPSLTLQWREWGSVRLRMISPLQIPTSLNFLIPFSTLYLEILASQPQ